MNHDDIDEAISRAVEAARESGLEPVHILVALEHHANRVRALWEEHRDERLDEAASALATRLTDDPDSMTVLARMWLASLEPGAFEHEVALLADDNGDLPA